MSDKKLKKRRLSLSDIIFTSVLLAGFGIKFGVFYSHLDLSGFGLSFTLVSLGILLVIGALVTLASHKAARVVLVVLYFVMSVIMGVDGVYFSYASKLTSIVQTGMVWQLSDITDTILVLIKFYHLINVLDLPLWVLWFIDRGLVRRKTPALTEKLSRPVADRFIVSGVMAAVAALFLAYSFTLGGFESDYFENELFYYHTNDIYKAYFAPHVETVIEKDEYIPGDESDSEYFGLAEGRNVFIIQVEAMQNFVIGASYEGQELTPNLNALIKNDSFYFDHYYYQIGGGNTADAEFAVNNSLFAPDTESAYMKYPDNDYFGLPKLLKANGYTGAYAFHGYDGVFWNREYAYVGQGFDDYTSLEDFDQTLDPTEADTPFPMGISDRQFFSQSLRKIKTYEEPFYSFMITLSSHYPFALPTKARGITLKPEDEAKLFGLYIQSINYFDRALGEFIDGLKEAGLYDNSVIVIYGDHYALTNTDPEISSRVSSMLGREYNIFDVFNVPCIIHIPGMDRCETVSTAGGHLDVLPTLLCLLGINNDKAVMFGQNLLDAQSGFVCEQTHLARGSFISDEVLFSKPYNNIRTNYDAYAVGTTEKLDPEDYMDESEYAAKRIAECMALLETNNVLIDSDGDENRSDRQE